MASASYDRLLVHGPAASEYHPEDDGLPNIYIAFSYDISVPSGSTEAVGTLTAGLRALQSGVFGYAIRCTGWIGNNQSTEKTLFYKPDKATEGGPNTWSDLQFGGSESFSATPNSDGNVYVHLRFYSNCSCRNYQYGSNYYIWARDIPISVYEYNKPSMPTLSVNKTLVDNGSNVTFTYSADTNYANGTEYIQYSLDKSTINTILAVSGEGSFNYTVNPGAGKSITMYCRRWLYELGSSGYSNWSDPGVTVQTNTNYKRPSSPTITPTIDGKVVSIVKPKTEVTFNYSSDSNYVEGTGSDIVQYKINDSSWVAVQNSDHNSGLFKLTLSNAGSTNTIYCRRLLVNAGLYSNQPYNSCTVNVYTNPTVSNIEILPASAININTKITSITWNSWSGNPGESCYSSVELRSSDSLPSTNIATLSAINSGNSVTNISLPNYLSMLDFLKSYDNDTIYVKVTRTHLITSDSATEYSSLTVRCRPISKITEGSLTTIPNSTIYENKTISWSYPSGYNGVVSGYDIVLHKHSDGQSTVNDKKYTSIINSYTINVSDLDKNVYYDISITPYFIYSNTKYYADNEVSKYTKEEYFRYIANPGVPTITYPLGGSWPTGNNSCRFILKLPSDPNFTESDTSNYKYQDVEVTVISFGGTSIYKISNEYHRPAFSADWTSATENNLQYEKSIIFDLNKVDTGSSVNSTLIVKFRVCTKDGIWSSYSSQQYLGRFILEPINTLSGNIIRATDTISVSEYCMNIFRTLSPSDYITYPSVGDVIYRSYFDRLHDKLTNICNVTSSSDIIDDKNLKYSLGDYSDYYKSSDDHPIIDANGYIKYLISAINELFK